ncbi:MAG: ferredoxin/flavodoxin---NADP+ reductase [Thermoleophilaceae bacterium]|jgi:ferredoxin--NADP+ reductase|nr:ferredoxin/flavodoxin---NADP+ reductase [Thermoleophilaceae bacterium]
MGSIGTPEQPLRVAVVGSGPSGFYAAGHLLKSKSHPDLTVQVDVYDRLPTPWGLVRGGVAPDHPNIKAVSRVYEKTAAHPEFRFYGNVEYGRDIRHDDLLARYHAVIYAVGAQTDRRMGIPGEDLPGSWAATEFVAWYNGHPDFRDREFDLSCERAIVIGNGNVAADVARMLALTRDELAQTDVADHALEALAESQIREIVVLGRRGPAQVAFTNPELLELGEMTDADVFVDPGDAAMDPLSQAWLESEAASATARKNVEILSRYSGRAPEGKRRRIVLRFMVSPLELLGDQQVEGIRLCRNELREEDGGLRACSTETIEELGCGIVFRSIGYRGTPQEGLPFDERRGTIPNEGGRILDDQGAPLRGDYAVGWIKRGPTGIIGTNKRDAQETVDAVLADFDAGRLNDPADPSRDSLEELLAERAPDHVTYAGWEAIDSVEKAAGEPHGRPRVKLTRTEELLEAARDRVS